MTLPFDFPYDDNSFVSVNLPASFESLPDKPQFPPSRRFQEIGEIHRNLVEKSGIQPGTYSRLESQMYSQIESVLDGLTEHLTSELSTLNALDLCKRLYQRHEEYLEFMLKEKYESIPSIQYGHSARQIRRRERAWQRISPLTESLRWLVEITVKFCESSTGDKVGGKKFDQLIVLAYEIFQWDTIWENVSHDMIPHEITVNADFSVTHSATPRGTRIQKAFTSASMPSLVKGNRQWIDDIQRLTHRRESIDREAMIGRTLSFPEFKALNSPLKKERGHSLEDWLRFAYGLLDSFEATKSLRVTKVSKLASFLSSQWNLNPDRLENLLCDNGLSKQTIHSIDINQLRPMKQARRDSRLLRRPIVVLDEYDNRLCIYGIDTFEVGMRMFLERLASGRLHLPNMEADGPLKRATGRVQMKLGDEFRDKVSDRCAQAQFENVTEKGGVGKEKTPEGSGFGPVDVFVVDRKAKRFVLIEAKDFADEGMVPRTMKNERRKVLRYLGKLNKQVDWFKDRIDALKSEWQIPSDEEYSVDGVIVINHPRLWMYAQSEPLPIIDLECLIKNLKQGEVLQTTPVP